MEKKVTLIAAVLIVLVGGFYFLTGQKVKKQPELTAKGGDLTNMKISSPAFSSNQSIPQKYTCDGEDVNPPLTIEDVPQGTKTLLLMVDDPDAPSGLFTHWLVINIDPKTSEILENSVPDGASQGKNDFGKLDYSGPCPPSGEHRYFFRLYALDLVLDLKEGATLDEVSNMMREHVLEASDLIGLYKRE